MYRTQFLDIEEFEVVRTTDKQVVYIAENGSEQRENKYSDWRTWHESKEEALDFLINKQKMAIEHTENRLNNLKSGLNSIIIKYS